MTLGGKRGNPKAGFPLFPPSLEIARDSHIPTGTTMVYTRSGDQLHPTKLSPMLSG